MAQRRQERRGTAAQWAATNPILASGEIGYQTDGNKVTKIGDGITAWLSLPYSNEGIVSATIGGLALAKGRTVVAPVDEANPAYEIVNQGAGASLHIVSSAEEGSTANYMLGIAHDGASSTAQSAMAISLRTKATGLSVNVFPQSEANAGVAIYNDNEHGVIGLRATLANADAGGLIRLLGGGAVTDDNKLLHASGSAGGGGYISAQTGKLVWESDVLVTTDKKIRTRQYADSDNGDGIEQGTSAIRLLTWAGADGYFNPKRIRQTSQSLVFEVGSTITGGGLNGSTTYAPGLEIKYEGGAKLATFGAAPAAQQVLATGAGHTVDDVITLLQTFGFARQAA